MSGSKVKYIIPAHLDSKRLSRKLLLNKTGKPLIQHTYEAVELVICTKPIVATDSAEIAQVIENIGGEVIMTGSHSCGTDRVAAAARLLDTDLIVNIQADEPEITPHIITTVVNTALLHSYYYITTLATPITKDDFDNPNRVKVVRATNGRAMYFSRAPIPYNGGAEMGLKHIGVYAYKPVFLQAIREQRINDMPLAKTEDLEQLAWMNHGFDIMVGIVNAAPCSIDTQDDYQHFVDRCRQA